MHSWIQILILGGLLFHLERHKDYYSGFNWNTYKLTFPTLPVCLQEITTGKEPSCDNSITARVCPLLPLALHADVFVLTSSSLSNYSSGPGAGSSSAGPCGTGRPASATAASNSPDDDGESSSRRCEEFFPVTGLSQQHVLFSLSICNHHRVSLSLREREAQPC